MARKRVDKNIAFDDERKLFYVTLSFGKGPDGKYKKSTVTAHTKSEAKAILKEHQKKKAAGTATPPIKDTLADVTKAYIDYKSLSLAVSTIYGYRNIWKNHIAPYFGKKKIQDVTAKDIQDYASVTARSGLSPNTVKKHIDLLSAVFQNAYMNRMVTENPIERMERFKTKKVAKKCMNSSELRVLFETLSGSNLRIPVMLAACLGLRRGEVLGLKWEHIDFEHRVLSVENTRTKVGDQIVEKQPKTEKSIRQLALSDELVSALYEHKKEQAKRRECSHAYLVTDYVVTMENGKPFSPNYLSDSFQCHLKKYGFRQVRFHDLRHSFASIANEAGASMYEISSAMGHSNIGVTSSIYTHEFSQTKAKAVNAVADSIRSAV